MCRQPDNVARHCDRQIALSCAQFLLLHCLPANSENTGRIYYQVLTEKATFWPAGAADTLRAPRLPRALSDARSAKRRIRGQKPSKRQPNRRRVCTGDVNGCASPCRKLAEKLPPICTEVAVFVRMSSNERKLDVLSVDRGSRRSRYHLPRLGWATSCDVSATEMPRRSAYSSKATSIKAVIDRRSASASWRASASTSASMRVVKGCFVIGLIACDPA